MVNVQLENGYLKVADELYEALFTFRFSPDERRIIDFIIRYSYGCNKKTVSLREWQDLCAAGVYKQNVMRTLDQLSTANVISIHKPSKTIAINKHYDQWCLRKVVGYNRELMEEILSFNLANNVTIEEHSGIPACKEEDARYELMIGYIPPNDQADLLPSNQADYSVINNRLLSNNQQITETPPNPNDTNVLQPPKYSIKNSNYNLINYACDKISEEHKNVASEKIKQIHITVGLNSQDPRTMSLLSTLSNFPIGRVREEFDIIINSIKNENFKAIHPNATLGAVIKNLQNRTYLDDARESKDELEPLFVAIPKDEEESRRWAMEDGFQKRFTLWHPNKAEALKIIHQFPHINAKQWKQLAEKAVSKLKLPFTDVDQFIDAIRSFTKDM